MHLRIIFCFLFLCSSAVAFGRDKEFQDKTYTVYLNYPTYSVRASVLHHNGKIKPREGYTYFWFGSNAIHETQGGFDGKLLHGEYKAFYLDNQLKEWGMFSNGRKTGEWKYWHTNGKLAEVSEFVNGKKHGQANYYNTEGKILRTEHYKHGKLHGNVTAFENDTKKITRYKKGNEVIPKPEKVKADSAHTKTKTSKTDSLKVKPAKADTTSGKKKMFGLKKKTTNAQPAAQPEKTNEKKPRKPLFRKSPPAGAPQPSSGFRS
ncbi:MAG: toxin-antitoxin system YwqK family antitoxin [Bacteroidetes bacterium]|nr:toxin-antitoxin system YwqK family antitoxin [Bacteroidota bacterium]